MVEIQSKEAIDKISDELKVQPAVMIPRELMDKIQLTYDIGEGAIRKGFTAVGERDVTGAGSLFTVPNDGHDYYLVHARLALTSDATYDGKEVIIRIDTADDNRASVKILSLRHNDAGAAAIAFQDGETNFGSAPLRLTAGSTVDIVPSFTAGSLESTGIIHMFKTPRQ